MPLQDANPTPSFGGFGLREAVEASDQALEVYTGDHYPFYHALVGGNREQARRLLDERTY